MNNQELIKLRNDIMDCFTCDEEVAEGGENVIKGRIDDVLSSDFDIEYIVTIVKAHNFKIIHTDTKYALCENELKKRFCIEVFNSFVKVSYQPDDIADLDRETNWKDDIFLYTKIELFRYIKVMCTLKIGNNCKNIYCEKELLSKPLQFIKIYLYENLYFDKVELIDENHIIQVYKNKRMISIEFDCDEIRCYLHKQSSSDVECDSFKTNLDFFDYIDSNLFK
jgi:hypothetical protein